MCTPDPGLSPSREEGILPGRCNRTVYRHDVSKCLIVMKEGLMTSIVICYHRDFILEIKGDMCPPSNLSLGAKVGPWTPCTSDKCKK